MKEGDTIKTLFENMIPLSDGVELHHKIAVDARQGKGKTEITLTGYDGAAVTYRFMFDIDLPKGDADG